MIIYLLFLIAAALPAYLIRFSVFSIPTTVLEILIYFSVIVVGYSLIVNRKKLLIPHYSLLIPIGLFLLAAIISTVIAPDKRLALGQLKAYFVDPLLVLWLVWQLVKTPRDKNIVLNGLLVGGLVVAGHAIYQYLSGGLTTDGRVVGLFGYSPNYLAMYLAPLVVVAMGLLLQNTHRRPLLSTLYLLLSTFFLVALYFSGSRAGLATAIIGLILIVILWFFVTGRKKVGRWVILLSIIGLIVSASWGWRALIPDFSLSPGTGGRITASNNIRWEIWKTTLEIIKQKPLLGAGLGNYQNYFSDLTKNRVNYPEYISPWALFPHNLYLAVWVNLGLLGLVSFVWLLVIFFKSAAHHSLTHYSLLITMVVILLFGLVDTPYFKNDLAVMWWVVYGLGMVKT